MQEAWSAFKEHAKERAKEEAIGSAVGAVTGGVGGILVKKYGDDVISALVKVGRRGRSKFKKVRSRLSRRVYKNRPPLNSASGNHVRIPNRFVRETVEDYIDRNRKLFLEHGGQFKFAGPPPSSVVNGVRTYTQGSINWRPDDMTIYLYEGFDEATICEELCHFRQLLDNGYWGKNEGFGDWQEQIWEEQIDVLFSNLGFEVFTP